MSYLDELTTPALTVLPPRVTPQRAPTRAELLCLIDKLRELVVALGVETRVASQTEAQALARRIIDAVAREFQVTPEAILSRRRWQHIVEARFMVMLLIREIGQITLDDVAELMGISSHKSIHHGISQIQVWCKSSAALNGKLVRLRAALQHEEDARV